MCWPRAVPLTAHTAHGTSGEAAREQRDNEKIFSRKISSSARIPPQPPLTLFPQGREPEVEEKPNRKREDEDRQKPFPRPLEIARLDGEDGDHEVIAETSVAQERAV